MRYILRFLACRRFAYVIAAVVIGSLSLTGCETSAEEAGRTDFFTFQLNRPGEADPVVEGYFYLPADHAYSHQEECGLFGWDFEGTAAKSDGVSRPVDDTAVQGRDTYVQYWATPDGSLCSGPPQFADAQFEYNGVRYILDGLAWRSFADLSTITIPPDSSSDYYVRGETWSRSDDPSSGQGDGYNWVMWPYEYFPSAPAEE